MSEELGIIQHLKKYFNRKVDYGYCKTRLFGGVQAAEDNEGIYNRDLDIFYIIKKASKSNAPYVIYFNGGPGVGFTDGFLHRLLDEDFFPNFNVVCMDQRGTGCSSKPSNNIKELKYFSARYIAYDAEEIRKQILGEETKWLIFGASYGGYIVRKYIELYPQKALSAISHGYGECSPVTMQVHIHLQLSKLIESYFKKYPQDVKTIQYLKSQLKPSDSIIVNNKKSSGKYLVDALAFFMDGMSDEKLHNLISNLDEEDIVNSYLSKIGHLVKIILNSSPGKLNSTVSYIDLMHGMSDKEINKRVSDELIKIGHKDNKIISKQRFIEGIEYISRDVDKENLDILIDEGYFKADSINFRKVIKNLKDNEIKLHVFSGEYDIYTPIQAFQEEEGIIKDLNGKEYYKFHYIEGGDDEWINNNRTLLAIISKFL